jgi:AraC family transcriptional regulator, alkane utilization regulator
MDVLSDALRSVRFCGSAFFTGEFSSPWAVVSPNPDLLAMSIMPEADQITLFHILLDGQCIVDCGFGLRMPMETGDVLVLPHGHAHTMYSEEGATPTPLNHVLSRPTGDAVPNVCLGGGGRTTRFICGYLNCTQRTAPMFAALPPAFIVRRRTHYRTVEAIGSTPSSEITDVPQESSAWLATTVNLTVAEALAARPGNAAMIGRLTELMFVEIIREYMQLLNPRERGWLTALKDPYVGKALRLIHESPMRSWTVDALAHEAAISRSGLAQRFRRLLGEPPIKYLSEWRIHLAKQLLRDRGDTIQAIAERIGYQSQPAFNRAFKKATGSPPAVWRRTAAHVSWEH